MPGQSLASESDCACVYYALVAVFTIPVACKVGDIVTVHQVYASGHLAMH